MARRNSCAPLLQKCLISRSVCSTRAAKVSLSYYHWNDCATIRCSVFDAHHSIFCGTFCLTIGGFAVSRLTQNSTMRPTSGIPDWASATNSSSR